MHLQRAGSSTVFHECAGSECGPAFSLAVAVAVVAVLLLLLLPLLLLLRVCFCCRDPSREL